MRAHASVPGLFLAEGVVPVPLELEVNEFMRGQDAHMFAVGAGANSRRVLQYGYLYDYTSKRVLAHAPAMPPVIQRLCELAATFPGLQRTDEDAVAALFNQCIINRYLPGQGLAAHTDNPAYGPNVMSFTFGSSRNMEFIRGSVKIEVTTPPGSAYLMTGASRYVWRHAMRGRKKDGKIPRGTVYSVTLRHVHMSVSPQPATNRHEH